MKIEDEFIAWKAARGCAGAAERKAERSIQEDADGGAGVRRETCAVRKRSSEVVRVAKQRARGVCRLCGRPAPFEGKGGEPYLEVHHVDWLSRNGADSIENVVALCPNRHAKIHVVDDPDDTARLKAVLARKSLRT